MLTSFDIPVIATSPNQWTLNTTNVLCEQTYGIPYGKHKQILIEDPSNVTCLVRDVECVGYESALRDCSFQVVPEEMSYPTILSNLCPGVPDVRRMS